MKFKDERCREEFYQAPTFLQVICSDFEAYSHVEGVDPLVTRVREAVSGSSGVHEWGRAVDFRDEHPTGVHAYSPEAKARIAKALNDKYSRRDGKPTLIWHSFAGGPLHAHVQMALSMRAYGPSYTMKAEPSREEQKMEADIVEGKIGEVGNYDVEFKEGKLMAKAGVSAGLVLLPGVSLALKGDVALELGARAVLEALKKAIPGVIDDAVLELAAKALGV